MQSDHTNTIEDGELSDAELSGVAGGAGDPKATIKQTVTQVDHIQSLLADLADAQHTKSQIAAKKGDAAESAVAKTLDGLLGTFEAGLLKAGGKTGIKGAGTSPVTEGEQKLLDKMESVLEQLLPNHGSKGGTKGGSTSSTMSAINSQITDELSAIKGGFAKKGATKGDSMSDAANATASQASGVGSIEATKAGVAKGNGAVGGQAGLMDQLKDLTMQFADLEQMQAMKSKLKP